MNISEKLSWEIVAMNDHGEASAKQRLALEICYGVSCEVSDPQVFAATMESVAKQVSDAEIARLIRLYARRGLK